MTAVFEWALANSLLALVLAIPAYASISLRRPALTHALWLLVLLRLITPPMWHVPIAFGTSTKIVDPIVQLPASSVTDSTELLVIETEEPIALTENVSVEPPLAVAVTPPTPMRNWILGLAILWAAGASGCLLLVLGRVVRFHRLLRHTKAAPAEWYLEAAPIAQRLGLRRLPSIRLVTGSVAPLLWAGFGRPVLLLPAALTNRLDAERRTALMAHELAHWRRGDYLVRWLELFVTAAFWWNPLVWLARRELREAEEQLCDAWVVWVLPDARRAYAAALVDTVEYLSERTPIQPALPPLASGFGEVRNLKRRIIMIMSGRETRRMTPRTLAMGVSLAAGLLAFTPSWADEPEQPPVPPTPPAAPRATEPKNLPPRNLDPDQAEEADRIRQSMRRMHEQLQRMEARLAEIEGRPAPRMATGRRAPADPAGPGTPGAPAVAGGGGEAPRARGFGSGGFGGSGAASGPGGNFGGGGFPGGPPGGGFGGMGGFGGGPNVERRIDEMQRALEQLTRELAEMRRAMQDQRGNSRGRGESRPTAGAVTAPAAPSAPTPPPSRSEPPPPPRP